MTKRRQEVKEAMEELTQNTRYVAPAFGEERPSQLKVDEGRGGRRRVDDGSGGDKNKGRYEEKTSMCS